MNEEPLRDILPPMLLPEEPNYTLIIGAVLLFCLLSALLFWFLKKRKKKVVLPGADEIALAELLHLRSLMVQEQASRYANKLSDILRAYIESRFHMPTRRQTTLEFFAELQAQPARTAMQLDEHTTSLKKCLDQCDLAKFARLVPDQHSMEQMETAVQQFVEATRKNDRGGK